MLKIEFDKWKAIWLVQFIQFIFQLSLLIYQRGALPLPEPVLLEGTEFEIVLLVR